MTYKIAFFLPNLENHGGVTVAVTTLSEYLQLLGHRVHLFPVGKTDILPSKYIHPIPKTKKKSQIYLAKKLFAQEEKNGIFDLVVTNTMPTNYIALHLNCIHKHVIVLHQASLFTKKDIFTKLKRRLFFPKLFNNRHIVMVSKCLESEFIKTYPYLKPKSTTTIFNALDKTKILRLSKHFFDKPDYDYILTLGRQTKNKNNAMLLHAFSKIKNKNIKLVLLGEGKETTNLKKFAKKLSLEKKVVFIPWMKNPYPWIKHAKIVISTSKSECMPLVLLEPLLLKVPIISTDIKCGPNEILTDDLKNYLVPIHNIEILTQTIDNALLSYPVITSKCIEKFNIKKISQQYLDIIKTL